MEALEVSSDRVDELRAYLAKDPVQNVYALGLLDEHGLTAGGSGVSCLGMLEFGKLVGAALIAGGGGLVIPCVFDPGSASELGQAMRGRFRLRGAFGERYAVDALLRAADCGPARWSRPQRLFAASADDLGPFVSNELRLGCAGDLPQLVAMSVAAIRELFGEEPPDAEQVIARRVEARLAAGRTFVVADGSRLTLKVDIGIRSRFGAEVEGLYTIPEARHHGLATHALGQLSRTMLSSLPRLVMRVDDKDGGLAAVCRKVGFTAMRPQRLVIVG